MPTPETMVSKLMLNGSAAAKARTRSSAAHTADDSSAGRTRQFVLYRLAYRTAPKQTTQ